MKPTFLLALLAIPLTCSASELARIGGKIDYVSSVLAPLCDGIGEGSQGLDDKEIVLKGEWVKSLGAINRSDFPALVEAGLSRLLADHGWTDTSSGGDLNYGKGSASPPDLAPMWSRVFTATHGSERMVIYVFIYARPKNCVYVLFGQVMTK